MSIYKGNKLVAGGPNRPNWTKAVLLDTESTYMEGYTAPSNGMIIGWFKFNNHIAILDLKINSITVARSSVTSSAINSEGNVQCPVNKGDSITLQTVQGGVVPSYEIDAALYFVPYKAQ